MKTKYKIYLMQHSHTDIGYTKSPEKTLIEQVKYIHFLIDKFDEIKENQESEYKNYKWICESFIVVEKFLLEADEDKRQKFINLVKEKKIEITAMYANLSELVDARVLEEVLIRNKKLCEKYGLSLKNAMNADINGLSREYAKKLVENGIENYFICIHTHHGMYPLFKKQKAFIWDLGDNKKLNVFLGEHYMFGNSFGFAKGAIAEYGFFDNIDFKKYNTAQDDSWLEMSKNRFNKYINQLEEDGYEYNFIPLQIHGKFIDNSMPSFDIAKRVNEFNNKYGDEIEVELTTLEEFFKILNQQKRQEVKGEWPDWWTDGVISAPAEAKIFKNIQAKYLSLKNLFPNLEDNYNKLEEELNTNLMLYSEHTYGSFDSITNPYHLFTHKQWLLKKNYLAQAYKLLDNIELKIYEEFKINDSDFNIAKKFKIINPSNYTKEEVLLIPFQNCDADSLNGNFEITNTKGEKYSYIVTNDYRKFPKIHVKLDPKEVLILNVKPLIDKTCNEHPYYSRVNLRGSDNIYDLDFLNNKNYEINAKEFKSKNLKIKWNENGIYSIIKEEEILNLNCGLFQPIYELSKDSRHSLGRNRKGVNTQRNYGKVKSIEIIEENKLYVEIKQNFDISGFNEYIIYIKIYIEQNKIEFKINCQKQIEENIENVYLNLPFKFNNLFINKGENIFNPWEDQLQGSLIDYYSVYDGIIMDTKDYNIILTTPDTPLLQLGSIDYQKRILCKENKMKQIQMDPKIWLMSNYWETNFMKNLAGFYEFEFSLFIESKMEDKLTQLKRKTKELLIIPVKEQNEL